ncbi:MAG: LexA family transcriptional regulator [Ruminiclostridium sp.]|nr:LexA family transcriptional regulator [Ruminiclostridium sp.]
MSANISSLTSKQKKVYQAIETYLKLKGIPPTVREIGEMVGEKTPGAVQGILNRLEQKQVIKRQLGAARSIQLVSADSKLYADPVYVPELKKISKRNIDDLANIYNISKYQPVPSDFLSTGNNHLIYRCPDDSLADSGIKQGDMLFIDASAEVKTGDIVLVLYNANTLLRYYHPDEAGDIIHLKADLDLIGKEEFSTDEIRIVGKLEGRYTKY